MIDILFYHGRSFVSKVIQWHTRSEISHVAMRRNGEVIEAWHAPICHGGAVYRITEDNAAHHNHTPGTRVDVFTVPRLSSVDDDLPSECSERIEKRAWTWACMQVGKPYDYRMVLRFIPRLPETDDSENRWFCSELVMMAFVVGGYPLLERRTPAYVHPCNLYMSPLINYSHSERMEKVEGELTLKVWRDRALATEDYPLNATGAQP